jgi:hypothetical protein
LATFAQTAIPAISFSQNRGIGQFIRQQLDPTFRGLYQPNAFDMMLLIPYFIVLVFLASYGIHRYVLVYLYYKNRKQAAKEPPAFWREGQLPRVTIQLPIFNEQFVIDRLVDAVCKINYPRERLDIQVLDDSTDETVDSGTIRGARASDRISPSHEPSRIQSRRARRRHETFEG